MNKILFQNQKYFGAIYLYNEIPNLPFSSLLIAMDEKTIYRRKAFSCHVK